MLAATMAGGIRLSQAQDESHTTASGEKTEQREKPVQPYRLDFSLNELQDGKKVNSRHYSMTLNADDHHRIRIGTRVPVKAGSGSYQYIEVGTTINARLDRIGDDLVLGVTSEISNLDTGSPQDRDASFGPVVRNMDIDGSALLVTGKAMMIGSVDDPNSNRQFELEVTATKLR
jgi:hypothetical protein